jgi:type VI secretion system protein ImpE
MNATDFYKAGRLQAAIDEQLLAVKANPTDLGKRMFLFELSAFAGDWERAKRQIDAMQSPDPAMLRTIVNYKACLECEDHRRKVFQEGIMPNFLVDPPEWLYFRLEAIKLMKAGELTQAREVLEKCDAEAPPPSLSWNGQEAATIRDCDDIYGPILEVYANGGYFWLPLEQVDGITANPPKAPRDLIWFPAKVSVKGGPVGDAFLPVLYPQSYAADKDLVKLGRETEWNAAEGAPVRGVGLRLFLVGEEAIPTPELRQLMPA